MQEVAKWINNRNGIVWRGDVTTDFDLTYFTTSPNATDGAYHTISLASIVDPGATSAYLRVSLEDNAADSFVNFRRVGYSNEANIFRVVTQVANITITSFGWVQLTKSATVEFKTTNTTLTTLNVTVCGWSM